MAELFTDPRWDTFGLLQEAYLAVGAAMSRDLDHLDDLRPELRDLMIRLARSPQHRLRPGELSRALSVTPSSMTRLIDDAEQAGMIQRQSDPSDRRACLVALTPDGLTRTTAWATASLESSVAHTAAHLTVDETAQLETLLRRLRDRAQVYIETGDDDPC